MALTQEEIEALVERKLLARKAAIVEAMLRFSRSPGARTFRDAEIIPDRLMGEALDDIMGEVLQRTAPEIRQDEPGKKNSGATGKG